MAGPGYGFDPIDMNAMFANAMQASEIVRQRRAAIEAQKQEQETLAAAQSELRGVMGSDNPLAYMEAQQRLLANNPKAAEAFTAQFKQYDDAVKTATSDAAMQAYALLSSGDVAGAKRQMEVNAERLENSGKPELARVFRDGAARVEQNPDAVKTALGWQLGWIAPDKFKKFAEVREAEGKAEKVTQEAAAIAEKRPFDLTKLTAESKIKEAEANLAPEKLRADLGLTIAQTASARASAASSIASAEASRATAERARAEAGQINAGVIPAEKRPEAEAKFRKEYSDQTKAYQEVKAAYGRIKASDETAAGDLALIFNYMKMLDPGSVVRESEFATAQNAAGVPDRIRNLYNRAITGERLGKEQRKEFVGQADRLYTQARTQETTVRKGIERIAKGYGLSTDNIFYEPEETAPITPPPPRLAPGAGVLREGGTAAGGFRVVGRRQQ